jgi:hypothetical protein
LLAATPEGTETRRGSTVVEHNDGLLCASPCSPCLCVETVFAKNPRSLGGENAF